MNLLRFILSSCLLLLNFFSKPIEIDVEDDDPQNQVEEDQVMEEATTKNIEITNDINTQKQKSKKRKKGKTIIPVE